MKSKLIYLRKCEVVLRDKIEVANRQKVENVLDMEYVETVKMFIGNTSGELYEPLEAIS
jgi:hypothetical protein